MKTTKWNKISRRGYALVLAAGLLIPGISQAAIVSGETTQITDAGEITVGVTVDGLDTIISIIWPNNSLPDEGRWVGISFGTDGTAHDNGYMTVSSLDGSLVYEANADFRSAPVIQTSQDLTIESFFTTGGVTELVLSRLSNTLDPLDFLFTDVEQTIAMQWALGAPGDPTSAKHELRGDFLTPLVLTAIPVPAAVWLFGSGLIGLIGLARRKAHA